MTKNPSLKELLAKHLKRLAADGFSSISGLEDTTFGATTLQAKQQLLQQMAQEVAKCVRCPLAEGRTNTVFGEGNPMAELMFIGEGPGKQEDLTGRPFVGAAGKLLDKIIAAMGFKREEVYIANTVKCRPERNRDPKPEEIAACFTYLDKQIRIIEPKVMVTLGVPATSTLVGKTIKMKEYRGNFHQYGPFRFMPTYHPSALLRDASKKRLLWEDMKKVMAVFNRPKD